MNTGKRLAAFAALGLAAGCLSSAALAADAVDMGLYTVTNISANDGVHDKYPVLNLDGAIAWMGQEPGAAEDDFEIFIYTPGTGIVQVTHNGFDDAYPEINDAGRVVWMAKGGMDAAGVTAPSADWEIWTYDAVSGEMAVLTDNDLDDKYPQVAANGNMAWNTFDGSDWEISYYDAAAGTAFRLTDNDYGDYLSDYSLSRRQLYKNVSFRMGASGELVWMGNGELDADGRFVAAGDLEIWHYDPGTGRITQVTDNEDNDWSPQINAAGDMVWETFDGSDYEIGYLSHVDGALHLLSDNGGSDYYPQLNDAGDVVWMSHDGNDWEIAMYDAASGVTSMLTDNEYDDLNQAVNSRGDIVWTTFDTGRAGGAAFVLRLYDATIGASYPITAYMSHFDSYPRLNDAGAITWFGSEWNGWEVYSATPNPVPATVAVRPGVVRKFARHAKMKALISLPELFDPALIVPESPRIVRVNGRPLAGNGLEAEGRAKLKDTDHDGVADALEVRFETEDLVETLPVGVAELGLAGTLADGTPFGGSVTILVKEGKKRRDDRKGHGDKKRRRDGRHDREDRGGGGDRD